MHHDPQLQTLFAALALALIVLPGFGHMLGGKALSSRILRTEFKIARAIIGYPLIWLGKLLAEAGKQLKG